MKKNTEMIYQIMTWNLNHPELWSLCEKLKSFKADPGGPGLVAKPLNIVLMAWDMVTVLGREYSAAIGPNGYPRQTFQEGSITLEYKRSGSSMGRALCAASWDYERFTLPGTPTDKKAAWRTERERMGWPWMTWRRQSHRKSQIAETPAWKAARHTG